MTDVNVHLSALTDAPREVEVEGIEQELTRLWKDAAETSEQESAQPVLRACSMNLIVVTDRLSETGAIAVLLSDVTVEHPARIFLIALERQAGVPSLEASISARCSVPEPGGKQVCCEQITIVARGTDDHKVSSLVTSLLVSDVPAVLHWKAPVSRTDPVFRSLAQIADRIFIDSSEILDPGASLLAWKEFMGERTVSSTFGDLAWTHLTEWRSLLAQAYQPREFREALWTIDDVLIEFSTREQPRHSGLSQALLLIAWLAHSLGWAVVEPLQKENSGYAGRMSSPSPIRIRIAGNTGTGAERGGIRVVSIRSGSTLHLRLEWIAERGCVRFVRTHSGKPWEEAVSTVRDRSESELVARELEVLQRDSAYEGTVSALASMLAVGER